MANTVRNYGIGGGMGIAIGLLGAGVQSRWPDKGVGTGLMIVGGLAFLITVVAAIARWHTIREYQREHPQAPTATPPQRLTQTANPHNESHNEFKPVNTNTVYVYPPGQPTQPADEIATTTKTIEPEPERIVVELEPNIIIEQPELLTVHQNYSDSVITEGVPNGLEHEMMLASIVPYRNLVKEGKPIGVARNIAARASYHRYAGGAPISKQRIAWLSEDHPRVFFERNDARKLVLAVQDLKERVFIVQREMAGTNRGRETRYTPLNDGIYSVRVSILDETDGNVKNKSEFILDIARDPKLVVVLQEARLWKVAHLSRFCNEGFVFQQQLDNFSKAIHESPEFEASNFVSNHDWQRSLRAGEMKREGSILDTIKDWENRAANFIGDYIGPNQQKAFLALKPTIAQGFDREKKHPLERVSLSPLPGVEPKPLSYEWTLRDAVDMRINEIGRLQLTVN